MWKGITTKVALVLNPAGTDCMVTGTALEFFQGLPYPVPVEMVPEDTQRAADLWELSGLDKGGYPLLVVYDEKDDEVVLVNAFVSPNRLQLIHVMNDYAEFTPDEDWPESSSP